jgi:taurine dioxygenase
MAGVSLDTTERRTAEERLRESEERLRAITDNLPSGMVYQIAMRRDGTERRFVYLSGSCEALTGVPAEDALPDPDRLYGQIAPEDRAALAVCSEIARRRRLTPSPHRRLAWRMSREEHSMSFTLTPLGYAMGAEVTGLDLAKPLDEATGKALYQAWLKHIVLVFKGAEALTPEQHIAFSRNFGKLDQHASQVPETLYPGLPEILLITNKPLHGKPSSSRNAGRNWHTDLSYTTRPAKGALLLCKEKPVVGGDTLFANQYLAYETLSPLMRGFLDGIEAVHDATLIKGIEKRDPAHVAEMKRRNPPVIHPVVRTHPETGRKSLLVNERISGFVGMTDEESKALLGFLNQHATSQEFIYRHRWSVGDILMWDNRCTCHIALPDFDQHQPRLMLRCSLEGEVESGRLAETASMESRESLLQAIAAAA